MEDYMLKGKELQILRMKKDIQGQILAKTLGISQSYVSKMEREKKPIPERLYKLWINILKGEKI
jgi:transcriptional regulator with XRE-family HTH domain